MSYEAQKKLADQVELEKLQKKVERMQELVPINGFYKAYFKMLNESESNTAAFNKLNDEYFELFGVYRYSSWDVFRNAMKSHNKKKKD